MLLRAGITVMTGTTGAGEQRGGLAYARSVFVDFSSVIDVWPPSFLFNFMSILSAFCFFLYLLHSFTSQDTRYT